MGGTVQDAHTRRVISRGAARAHGSGEETDRAACAASTEEDSSGRASATLAREEPTHDPGAAARMPDEQRTSSPREAEAVDAPPLDELPRTPPEPQPTTPAAEEHAEPDPGSAPPALEVAFAPAEPVVDDVARPWSPQITCPDAVPEPPMAPLESNQSVSDKEPAIDVADDEPEDSLKDIKSPGVAASPPQRRCLGRAAKYDHIKSRLFEITATSKAKIVSSERGRRTQVQADPDVTETCQPASPTAAVLRPGCADTAAETSAAPKHTAWLGKMGKATGIVGNNLTDGLVGNSKQPPAMRGHLTSAVKFAHPRRPSTQGARRGATDSFRSKSMFLSKGPQPSPFGLGSSLAAIDAESFLREVIEGGKTIRQATDGQRQSIFPARLK